MDARKIFKVFIFVVIYFTMSSIFAAPTAYWLEVNGAITPASQDYILQGLDKAKEQNADMVILQMDTPGGLETAMHEIIKGMSASSVPVIVYVAPEGSRAASAGTYILYASHLAAMAPATHAGAATPVGIGFSFSDHQKTPSTLEKKSVNDAIAYIRGLAQEHHRNVDFAEKAVKEAATISSDDALKQGVIEIIAKNTDDLMQQLNGKTVTVLNASKTLDTKNITIIKINPNWRARFLAVITDPTVAYFLLLLGVYGIFFEFMNPGFVLPGVVGAISLILAMYAFQLLPINYAGLALIILGIAFMIAEFFIGSFGAIGVGGIVAFIAGSVMLLDVEGTYAVPWGLIFTTTLFTSFFFFMVIRLAIKSKHKKIVTGGEAMIGQLCVVRDDFNKVGWVKCQGEFWQARTEKPLKKGQIVQVIKIHGLTLTVELATKGEE